jgi:hypothetical protein
MSRTINDLRNLLFSAMEDLKNGKIDVNQAKQMANLGQVIVNSAVAETRHLKDQGGSGTGFIQEDTVSNVKKIGKREETMSEHEKIISKYL